MKELGMEPVLLTNDEDGVAVLRVNRPRSHNALNRDAQERFAAAVQTVRVDRRLRVLIITGSGERAFVSGGDLLEIAGNHDEDAGRQLNRIMSEALAGLIALPIPVIAAINGDAFGGGCEIITACDLRVAAPKARFSFAQVRNGLTTGWGGSERLVRLLGLSRASELLLTGRLFEAREAFDWGLVHRLVSPAEDVLEAARAWADDLVQLPASALAAQKKLLYAAAPLMSANMQDLERTLFNALWAAPDHLEALEAFTEKRAPRFKQITSDKS
jgi:enoyl-CoA hydratase